MDAKLSSETFITIWKTIRRHKKDDQNPQLYLREDIKHNKPKDTCNNVSTKFPPRDLAKDLYTSVN
jgi:hypothetical protein